MRTIFSTRNKVKNKDIKKILALKGLRPGFIHEYILKRCAVFLSLSVTKSRMQMYTITVRSSINWINAEYEVMWGKNAC